MPENLYEVPKEKVRAEFFEEYIAIGQDKKLIEIGADSRVKYVAQDKRYDFRGPEEKVRASFYVELVEKYKYPSNRLDLEVIVPRRKPEDKADIVVYEDEERKRPYIVVECKKDGISKAEINQAVEQAFGNANSLRAKYAILVAGNVRIAFDVAGFKPSEREKNIIADIPIRYGKVIQYKYKKGDPDWDPREADRNEVLAKFQQCHDILWEGGKRNPAEAFDEMSKLMFCKIHDERFITKIGEYYRFQIGTHENIREVADRVKEIYRDAQEREPGVFTEPIKAEDPLIYSVVEILQGVSLSKTDLDAKGVAFEHFLGKIFRGEMGQYFTPRTIVEFMVEMLDPSDRDCVIDPACGSGGFLLYALDRVRKEVEQKLDPEDARDRWKDFGLYGLFGIEINSQLARVSMMNMIIHEDGHSNIENNDALDDPSKFYPRRDIGPGKYTMLMTNPPFGAVVKDREKDYLRKYELGGKIKWRKRQNTEILFLERCLDFLRPGGKMGIVLPDGILTNSSLQYVRDFITERAQVLAVVSLPQTAFTHYGAGVKASLLFLRKKRDREFLAENYPIFMAIAGHIGYDATGRPDKNEFPEILEAYRKFLKGERSNFPNASLCFVVERGELEGRWEPAFYRPALRKLIERLNNTENPVTTLGNMLRGLRYGTSSPPTYVDAGIPFIRATNIKNGQIITYDMKYMSRDEAKKFAKCQVKKDNVIIVRSGVNTGDCTVVSKEFNGAFAAYDLILTVKDELNPQYLNIFLNSSFGKGQIERLKARSAQPHLNAEEVKSFRIPLPPREIQDRIAKKIDDANKIKKEKETEAGSLLNSIEDYILGELGITLPELKDEKCFTIIFGRIKGNRLDPYYHQPKYSTINEAVIKGKYPIETLGKLLISIVNGLDYRKFTGTGTKYLRVGNIKPNEIDDNQIKFIPIPLESVTKDIKLKPGDMLLTRKGTFGISAVVMEETNFIISSEVMRLRLKKEINPLYFSIVNNATLVQEQYKQKAVGAIMGSLSQEVLKTIKIPLPPLSIQEKITQEVRFQREKAKKLRKEAKEIVEKAKEEVERMILGEGENKGITNT